MSKPVNPVPGIPYTVVKKRDLPPPRSRARKPGMDHGAWVRLVRLVAILAPDEAVRVSLTRGWTKASVMSSLHSAARLVGLRLNTCTDERDRWVYVVRVGRREPVTTPGPGMGVCRYCGQEYQKVRHKQEVCGERVCQLARVRDNNRAYDARRKNKGEN